MKMSKTRNRLDNLAIVERVFVLYIDEMSVSEEKIQALPQGAAKCV